MIASGYTPTPKPLQPTNMPIGSPYGTSVLQQAGDYDSIMQGYKDLMASQSQSPVPLAQYNPISPQMQSYDQGQDFTSALSMYKNSAQTGGYSPEGLAAIRARGVSPIRSIYANAQRNIEKQRSLQGGYSPSFNAASTRMAREMSEQLSQANTGIEADIADRTAQGKQSALSGYGSLASQGQSARNQANQANASATNQANQANAANALAYNQNNQQQINTANQQKQQALQGMSSLYGTTPALASTYGSQALQAGGLAQNAQQMQIQAQNEKNRMATGLATRFGSAWG